MEAPRAECYFRLPRPAAVSTLAALTSPAAAAGGAETRRSCLASPRGGKSAGLGEAGRRGGGEAGRAPRVGGPPRGWAGPSGLPYLAVTPASPNVPR